MLFVFFFDGEMNMLEHVQQKHIQRLFGWECYVHSAYIFCELSKHWTFFSEKLGTIQHLAVRMDGGAKTCRLGGDQNHGLCLLSIVCTCF